jgi:N-acetylmuramoyl-L-alanine amidase
MPPGTEPEAPEPGGLLLLGPGGADYAPDPRGRPAGRLAGGVLLPVLGWDAGWTRVLTPCERVVWIPPGTGSPVAGTVALDPGHGGNEPGAIGPAGLEEKELNLDVARRARTLLAAAGVAAVLTHPEDYRATLAVRTAVAGAMGAALLVSIHHNAEPDGPSERPGTETYHQHASGESRRLAGLLYEELVAALAAAGGGDVAWVSNLDAGAKWRLDAEGADYYGMLRRPAAAGIPSCITEFAFLSNPDEEALLERADVREGQARALTAAVVRFLTTPDPGSGYVAPVHRSLPAGTGGGLEGCLDPV